MCLYITSVPYVYIYIYDTASWHRYGLNAKITGLSFVEFTIVLGTAFS